MRHTGRLLTYKMFSKEAINDYIFGTDKYSLPKYME